MGGEGVLLLMLGKRRRWRRASRSATIFRALITPIYPCGPPGRSQAVGGVSNGGLGVAPPGEDCPAMFLLSRLGEMQGAPAPGLYLII